MTTEYTKNFGLALPDFRMGPWHDLLNDDLKKLDQIVYGALSSVDTGLWLNDTAYTIGVTAYDGDDATTWMCNVDHTTPSTGTFADERAANPTYWVQLLAGFAPRGEWQRNTNYYPYDLVYQTSTGVLALCQTRHVSNSTGNILDDEAYWAFLVNFSGLGSGSALSISYVPAPGLTSTNVQGAIDQVESQIHALNSVNISQGSDITALQSEDTSQDSRLTAVESTNTTQDTQISALQTSDTSQNAAISALNSNAVMLAGNQNITGGFTVTPKNLGNLSNFTLNATQHNYQYGNNVGAITISAPTADCGIDLLVTNASGAGAITFSGFTVSSNIGDPLTTIVGNKFLISFRRIAGTSTYVIKALQ